MKVSEKKKTKREAKKKHLNSHGQNRKNVSVINHKAIDFLGSGRVEKKSKGLDKHTQGITKNDR
jgi:hypothetical protein